MVKTEIPGKHTPSRNAVAEQIMRSRQFDLHKERKGPYLLEASLVTYNVRLNGLSAYLDYIRSFDGSRVVLDIGAGTTRAVAELEKSEMGRGIDYRATVLLRDVKRGQNSPRLDSNKVYKTSVERLAGIEDGAISGIISNRGLTYSSEPTLSVKSINRVLRPGGVIKANFEREDNPESRKGRPAFYWKSHKGFAQEFSELGYDIAYAVWGGTVLLAIKPGGDSNVSALELLKADEAVRGVREELTVASLDIV